MDNYKSKIKDLVYSRYHLGVLSKESNSETTAFRIVNSDILEKFKSNGVNIILEAGCGDGRFLVEAKKNGMTPYGFDSNQELVNTCRKKGIKAKKATLSEKLPYSDNYFDGIYCTNVIEHTTDPDFALYELYRLLKPGGLLLVVVPDIDYSLFYDDWTHIKPFTKRTMRNIAIGVGIRTFKISLFYPPILVKYWDFLPVRWLNYLLKIRPFADVTNFAMSHLFHIYRHYVMLEASK